EDMEAGEDVELDLTPGTLEKTNDPVRMYLREMGTVPLLTREGEVEIAKRIERGQLRVLKAISRSPIVINEVLAIGEDLKRGVRSIKEVVIFDEEEITDEIVEARIKATTHRIDEIHKHFKKKVDSTRSEELKKEYRRQQRNCKADLEKMEQESGLTFIELKRTQREITQGDIDAEYAKRELIEANLRLVVSIAKKYTNRGLQFL